ncbi:MAG: biotin/lipoate A/B protein ligase family protein [Lachnospiraceae bacterium]
MQYIELDSRDVYLNLAAEDYIFHHFTDDSYLLFYRNDPSIVLGKYQNIYQEISVLSAAHTGIKIARRMTGGGTVFHDSGNLNYAFLAANESGNPICYDDFLFPVINALREMGINAQKRNTCDIAIGNLKISGNAQSVHGRRVLHHGTLLFDTDLNQLHQLLTPTNAQITSKAVRSVPSSVTNIRPHLMDPSITIEQFQNLLLHKLFPEGFFRRTLTKKDREEIQKLRNEKYATWDWNFGHSPRFTLRREGVFLSVDHGYITQCTCRDLPDSAANLLAGQRYDYHTLLQILSPVLGDQTETIVTQLF